MLRIKTTDGRHAVNIIRNGDGGDYLAIAELEGFDGETMSDWGYWFTIGWYKTVDSAQKWAAKKLHAFGLELEKSEQPA